MTLPPWLYPGRLQVPAVRAAAEPNERRADRVELQQVHRRARRASPRQIQPAGGGLGVGGAAPQRAIACEPSTQRSLAHDIK